MLALAVALGRQWRRSTPLDNTDMVQLLTLNTGEPKPSPVPPGVFLPYIEIDLPNAGCHRWVALFARKQGRQGRMEALS